MSFVGMFLGHHPSLRRLGTSRMETILKELK